MLHNHSSFVFTFFFFLKWVFFSVVFVCLFVCLFVYLFVVLLFKVFIVIDYFPNIDYSSRILARDYPLIYRQPSWPSSRAENQPVLSHTVDCCYLWYYYSLSVSITTPAGLCPVLWGALHSYLSSDERRLAKNVVVQLSQHRTQCRVRQRSNWYCCYCRSPYKAQIGLILDFYDGSEYGP